MDDDLATIRSQMNQTRTNLSEKLESLEGRVAEGMQSTGAAVSHTVTSVREAMQSVSQALDFSLQVRRHPWIAFSASFALGCLAARLSPRPAARTAVNLDPSSAPSPADCRPPRSRMLSSLGVVIRDAAALTVPLVMEHYFRPQAGAAPSSSIVTPAASTGQNSSWTLPGPARPNARQFGSARSL